MQNNAANTPKQQATIDSKLAEQAEQIASELKPGECWIHPKIAERWRVERVVERIADFIKEYCVLPDERLYRLLALWIVQTHNYQEFEYTGYVYAHSPEHRSGKTILLQILDALVFNSSEVLTMPTEAVLFRTAHNATQILDELDEHLRLPYLTSILNAGFAKSGRVPRTGEPDKNGQRKIEYFPVYAPRALASVGIVLKATTLDRCFSIRMLRQRRMKRFLEQVVKRIGEQFRKDIAAFWQLHKNEVEERYRKGDFKYLDRFEDRTKDVTEPLAAILEYAYCGLNDPHLMEKIRGEFVEAIAITRNEENTYASEHLILRGLLKLAESTDPLVGMSSELAEDLRTLAKNSPGQYDLPENFYDGMVTKTLRRYGFSTQSARRSGSEPRNRYVLSKEKLAAIVNSYST
jgi:hypothetical protein